MLILLALITSLLLLSACKDVGFYEGMDGPSPVPYKKADWRSFGKKADFEMRVDVNSIQHEAQYSDSNYAFVWMQQRFNDEQIDGVSKGKYQLKYTRSAIHCESTRMAQIAVALHDLDDNEVARYDVPGFQWEFAEPAKDSYGSDFVRQVCQLMAEKDKAAQEE